MLPLVSYPEHAGEADPGPGPPGQSGGQRQRDRGHPEKGSPVSRQRSTVFPETPVWSTQARPRQIHARRSGKVRRAWGRGTLLWFPLSDGPQSRIWAPLPLSLACSLLVLLSLSLPLPSSLSLLKSGNFIPRRKGRWGWVLAFIFLPPTTPLSSNDPC